MSTVLAIAADASARTARKNEQDADEQKRLAEQRAEEAKANETRALEEKQRAEQQRDRADRLLFAGQLALAQREWQDNNFGHALDLLDACQTNLRGWEHRFLYTLFTSNQRTLRGHTSGVSSVCWSPDGKRLGSAGQDGTVRVWDAQTGREALVLKGHTTWVHCVSWSSDGKRLASGSGNPGHPGDVRVWDATPGKEPVPKQTPAGGEQEGRP